MYQGLVQPVLGSLRAVREHVNFSSDLRGSAGAHGVFTFDPASGGGRYTKIGTSVDLSEWRIIDHCAAITRAYAIFERFFLVLVEQYIWDIARVRTFGELNERLRETILKNVGRFLGDHDKERYSDINPAEVIREIHEAMEGKLGYEISGDVIIRQEQNLRVEEIVRILSSIGFEDVEGWLKRHPLTKEFFESFDAWSNTISSQQREIIKYRNEAAHGLVEEVLGADVLIEFTYFLEVMCKVMCELVTRERMKIEESCKRVSEIGHVSERFSNNVCIVRSDGGFFWVGQRIYLVNDNRCRESQILEIQLEDSPYDKLICLYGPVEVGLRLDVVPGKRDRVLWLAK